MVSVNYGKILAMKERDNPASICRASYLISNASDVIKNYGRALRFPSLSGAYLAEVRLAPGDVLMQVALIEASLGLYSPFHPGEHVLRSLSHSRLTFDDDLFAFLGGNFRPGTAYKLPRLRPLHG